MDTTTFLHFSEVSRAEFVRYTNLCRVHGGLEPMTPEQEERDYEEWKQTVINACNHC